MEGEHPSTIVYPQFSKQDVQVRQEPIPNGTDKRVLRVTVTQEGRAIPAVLKLMRPYRKDDHVLRNVDERNNIAQKEYDYLKRIQSIVPSLAPDPLGIYSNGQARGIIVEEVIGESIYDENKREILIRPTEEQVERFREAIETLFANDLYVDGDSTATHNLMIGHTAADTTDRIITVDTEKFIPVCLNRTFLMRT